MRRFGCLVVTQGALGLRVMVDDGGDEADFEQQVGLALLSFSAKLVSGSRLKLLIALTPLPSNLPQR